MPIDPRIPLMGQPVDVAGDMMRREQGRLHAQTMQQQIEANALRLQEAKKQAAYDPAADEQIMQEILAETGGDLEKVPGALAKRGMFKQAMEVLKGWDEHVKATKGTPQQPNVSQIQTVDEQGNPVIKFVEQTAGTSYPMAPKAQAAADLPASAKEYEYAKANGFTGTFEQYQNNDANRKRPVVNVGGAAEPLVAVMGPDGLPVLVRRSQAEGKRPASNREQGRPVTSGDANKITDLDSSISDLATLSKTVSAAGSTGIAPSAGAAVPNWVTNATGFGVEAKQRQATIDRVKQVIGKALEGGVLRKEDEMKYAKILPTISDSPQVVATKLAGLKQAISQRKSTLLDNLSDAGYDTSRFESRGAAPSAPAGDGMKVGPYTVRVKP